jgi:hypothetical protein
MMKNAQWWAMHRHDIPVNGDWSGFAGVVHNGYRRQDTIIRRNPALYSVIYVPPFCSVSIETNRLLDFPNYGNLFDGYDSDLPRTGSEFRWSWFRGWWVNWTRVDIDQIIERWRPHVPKHVAFWMVDNIPEWYHACGRNATRFVEQVHALCKCLRNIADVPVFGNIYQGGAHADAFLRVADGLLFENWLWFWANGSLLADSTRRTIQQRVERALTDSSKFVVLHVPAMQAHQVEYAKERVLEMLERYGAKRVLFYEHRPARGTVSVRRQMMQISGG